MGKSIAFSAAMQYANLQGRKCQTRRLTEWQPVDGEIVLDDAFKGGILIDRKTFLVSKQLKPRFVTGEKVWIKEPWVVDVKYEALPVPEIEKCLQWNDVYITYLADDLTLSADDLKRKKPNQRYALGGIRSADSMIEKFCRSSILVRKCYFQRLQNITEYECFREGIQALNKFVGIDDNPDVGPRRFGITNRGGKPFSNDYGSAWKSVFDNYNDLEKITVFGWDWDAWCESFHQAFRKSWDQCYSNQIAYDENPWVEVIEYEFVNLAGIQIS